MTKTISAPELLHRITNEPDLKVIDVRTSAEFESFHIPGSHSLPLTVLDERVDEVSALGGPTVLVCQSGARSGSALEIVERAGMADVCSLDGGLNSWQAVGAETAVGSTDKWAMDRQVRLAAGSLVVTGILGSLISPNTKWLSGGIGAGLVYSALSNTCTMGDMLSKLPYNQSEGYDADVVLQELKAKA